MTSLKTAKWCWPLPGKRSHEKTDDLQSFHSKLDFHKCAYDITRLHTPRRRMTQSITAYAFIIWLTFNWTPSLMSIASADDWKAVARDSPVLTNVKQFKHDSCITLQDLIIHKDDSECRCTNVCLRTSVDFKAFVAWSGDAAGWKWQTKAPKIYVLRIARFLYSRCLLYLPLSPTSDCSFLCGGFILKWPF